MKSLASLTKRAAYIVYLDFSKAFASFFGKIFTDELLDYGLEMQTVRWTEN